MEEDTGLHAPDEDESLTPRIVGHPSSAPVSAESVRNGYANLIRGINKANKVLPEDDRFHVPFGVQEALVRYIEEREAIDSILKAAKLKMCPGDTDFCPHHGCTTCQGPLYYKPDPDNGAGKIDPGDTAAWKAYMKERSS